jgi:DNA polymerase III epsilon subunit family exonuclease
MTENNGPPLWASLFDDAQPKHEPPSPWYRRRNGAWEGVSWPDPVCGAEPWETRTYVALDVETTGLNPTNERIVEIALVPFAFDAEGALIEIQRFAALVNPGIPIPSQASRIHGIRAEDVANEPLFGEVAPAVLELCKSRVIVGHNVMFDIGFLERELGRAGYVLEAEECADSFGMAKIAFPAMQSYNLGKLAFALGLPSDAAHRALGDALTSMRLFAATARTLASRCVE